MSVIDNRKYAGIMNLPHHVSPTRPQMPISDRAAQFSPFAALTGYAGVIRETARLTDRKIELDETMLTALNERYQRCFLCLMQNPRWRSPILCRMNANPAVHTAQFPVWSKRRMNSRGG